MRRYRWTLPFLAAVTLAAAAPARADTAVAVLGIEPIDVPEALAQALTEALRQRASATGGVRIVPGKDLVELKMIFGCDGETPQCMSQAGRSLGAEKLLFGTLKKAPGHTPHVVVALKLLDVSSSNVERFVNDTVLRRELQAPNVTQTATKWFASLVEVEVRPTLSILSDPTNAAVAIDGQPAGRTPITLRDLTPGTHTIAVTVSGHTPATRTVELKAGGNHEVSVTLEAEATPPTTPLTPPEPVTPPPSVTPPPPVAAPAGHPGRPAKAIAIAAGAAALVAGAVAIYTWRTYRDLEDTAHSDLVALKPPGGVQADQVSFFKNPGCTPPSSLGSGAAVQKFKDDCSSGSSYADATTALWIVAGALATAGVVSYVIGDRQAAHAREKKPASTAQLLRESLRLAPVFTNRTGGLSAAFEF